jgi:hypothetical protein
MIRPIMASGPFQPLASTTRSVSRVRTSSDGILRLFLNTEGLPWWDAGQLAVMDNDLFIEAGYEQTFCCAIVSVQLRNGMYAGISYDDGGLRTSPTLHYPQWEVPANPGSALLDLVVLQDGSILGVDQGNCLVHKSSVDAAWVPLSYNSLNCGIKSVGQLHNGTLLAVNMVGQLMWRDRLFDGDHSWQGPIATDIRSITTSVPTGASQLADGCSAPGLLLVDHPIDTAWYC